MWGFNFAMTVLALSAAFIIGCDLSTDDNSGDLGKPVGLELDTDSESATMGTDQNDTDPQDTESSAVDTDSESEFNPNYPLGPFGFKAATQRNGNALEWVGGGDTFPNICLRDKDENTVCMADHYDAPATDLFVIDFAAVWCGTCRNAARDENEFIDQMATLGWNVRWFTILEEDQSYDQPTLSDATNWESSYAPGEDVLVDEDWAWRSQIKVDKWPGDYSRSYPIFFVVQPANMMIWEVFSGWSGSLVSPTAIADRAARYDSYKNQPGAID